MNLAKLAERLDRVETTLSEIHNLLIQQRTVKDWYSTAELAQALGKAEFTVREWCRLGRIRAEKRACGRGRSQEWIVSRAELEHYQNHGLRPLPKYRFDG